ncbi:MAG: hypothetical protein HN846_03225 [Candidatus Pacebacteria bacterium]|nr:hypothetical protein [Candidatus Paceibacterota bacterium]MBT3511804.1 hypothetical protein [Candidatus Paceibacterota bacterium]MBT4005060.1 hypothetical protein [Candidatus Paceibacterota bacterium]MBT4358441.1 hypothetical protein [Candidatus Paceibacterota bacterium]MBT4680564.1 hypothetical protein [Candidatus Paceibacterota bacterium]
MKNPTPSTKNDEKPTSIEKKSWWEENLVNIKQNSLAVALTLALIVLIGLGLFIFFQNSKKQLPLETTNYREKIKSPDSKENKESEKSFAQLFEKSKPTEKQSPSPLPSPAWILPGKETYAISQGDKAGPRIANMVIDPQDPTTNNNQQTVSSQLKHSLPIEKVTLKLTSDNEEKSVEMTLVEGTNKNGTWQTQWEITDPVLYKYILTLVATSSDGESIVDISIR